VPFFQIKSHWAPLLSNQSKLGAIFARIFMEFAQSFRDFRKFSQILPRFPLILPGFSPNQNLWGCACTPVSDTTDWNLVYVRNSPKITFTRTFSSPRILIDKKVPELLVKYYVVEIDRKTKTKNINCKWTVVLPAM